MCTKNEQVFLLNLLLVHLVRENQRDSFTRRGKKYDHMISHFVTDHQCQRQANGQNYHNWLT